MKKTLSYSLVLAIVFGIATIGALGLTSSQVQAAENTNKVDVFVSFDKTPGLAEANLVRAFGGTVSHTYTITPAIAASIPETAIKGLLNNPHVTAVEMDGQVQATVTEFDNAWGVAKIGADTVQASGNTGAGVKIGIIDSGVNYNHNDLVANFDPANRGYDYVQDDNDPMDVYGHGTHVAGTACAKGNGFGVIGVAPDCALYSIRVLNDSGVGSWNATIAALQWAVDNGMQVVNLSLGSSGDPGTAVKTAFDNANAAGIVIVAAAGNSGNKGGAGDNIIYPAKYASVIAVGATDSTNTRASFSSTGSTLELMAPGESVLSTWNDDTSYLNPQPICLDNVCYYKYGSGTSMASPHVAGAAALLIAAGITNNNEVRSILDSTATDKGAAGKDTLYGYGLVNVAAAIASLVPPSPSVNVNVSTDKSSYENGIDTTAVLTAVITDENGTVISGLIPADFGTNVNGVPTVVSFIETTAGTYIGNLDISGLPDGSYTVTETTTDTRSISGSGSAIFSIAPTSPKVTTATVSSITYATNGGKNGDKNLNTYVAVIDNLGNHVANASVSITLNLNGSFLTSGSGTTGSNGVATFSLRNAPSGTYTTVITAVTATGLTWDGDTPSNGITK